MNFDDFLRYATFIAGFRVRLAEFEPAPGIRGGGRGGQEACSSAAIDLLKFAP